MKGKIILIFSTVILALNVTMDNLEASPITDGLVAAYDFSGNANDNSGNGHDGDVHGAVLSFDRFGNPDSAYSFDGVDDYIDAGAHPLSYEYASVSLWAKTDDNRDNYGLFAWNTSSNNGGIDLGVGILWAGGPENVVNGAFRDDAWSGGSYPRIGSSTSVADNEWHHICFVYDGDARLYVDGSLENILPRSSTLSNQNQYMYFGHLVNQAVGQYHFQGHIDDIYIFNRALSEDEVGQLSAVPVPGAIWLFGSGLAGLIGFIRKAQK
jgi:hypothetical protein